METWLRTAETSVDRQPRRKRETRAVGPCLRVGFPWLAVSRITIVSIAVLGSGLFAAAWAQTSVRLVSTGDVHPQTQIEAALARRQNVRVSDLPLGQLASSLSRYSGINVVVDERALADADADLPFGATISVELRDVTLRTALDTMLRPLRLTWLIHGETLLITTQAEAESKLDVRVYPIKDLALLRDDEGNESYDFDELIDLITTTVEPVSWDTVGGRGSLSPSETAGALVCSQTREVHEQVEALLDTLRRVRNAGDRRGATSLSDFCS